MLLRSFVDESKAKSFEGTGACGWSRGHCGLMPKGERNGCAG